MASIYYFRRQYTTYAGYIYICIYIYLHIYIYIYIYIYLYQGFLSRTLTTHRTAGERRGPSFIPLHSTISIRPQTLRHLFASLHVRWLSHIFNRNACVYQTATWWDLPPYRITIWLIDDVMLIFVCLHADLILSFVRAISYEKPVDLNSHRLSSLYYKPTDLPSVLISPFDGYKLLSTVIYYF